MAPADPGGGPVKKLLLILAILSLGVALLAAIRNRRGELEA